MVESREFWYIGAAVAGGAVLLMMLRPRSSVVVVGQQDNSAVAAMLAQIAVAGTNAVAQASSDDSGLKAALGALSITSETARYANDALQGVANASLQSLVQSKALDVEERIAAMDSVAALTAQSLQSYGTLASSALVANTALTQTAVEHATAVKLANLQAALDIASLNAALTQAQIKANAFIESERIASHTTLELQRMQSESAQLQTQSQERITREMIDAGREQASLVSAIQSQALESDFFARMLSTIAGLPYIPGDYSTLWGQTGQIAQGIGEALIAANTANLAIASQNFQTSEMLRTQRQGQQLGFIADLVGSVVKGITSALGAGAS